MIRIFFIYLVIGYYEVLFVLKKFPINASGDTKVKDI